MNKLIFTIQLPLALLSAFSAFPPLMAAESRCPPLELLSAPRGEIAPASFVSAATKIQAEALYPTEHKFESRIREKLYEAISSRDSYRNMENANPWVAMSRDLYQSRLALVEPPNPHDKSFDTADTTLASDGLARLGYCHLTLGNASRMDSTLGKNPRVRISYKSYFTVAPKDYSEAAFFLGKMETLHKKLYELNARTGGAIQQLKLPTTLDGMVNRVDSLVIHYNNPAVREEVERIVQEVMATGREVALEQRPIRGNAGFDFRMIGDLKGSGSLNGSHGQLIAAIAARKLAQRRKDVLTKLSSEELGREIQALTNEIKSWSPEKIYQELSDVK